MRIAWVSEPTEVEWDLKRSAQDHPDVDLTLWSVTDLFHAEYPADRGVWTNSRQGRLTQLKEIASESWDLVVLRYPYYYVDNQEESVEARKILKDLPVVVWLSEQGPMRWWAKEASKGWPHVAVNNHFEVGLYKYLLPDSKIHYMPVGCAAWRDDELVPDEQYRCDFIADGYPHATCRHWGGYKGVSVKVMIEPFVGENLRLYGPTKHAECAWTAHPLLKFFHKGEFKPNEYPKVYAAAKIYLGVSWNWAFSGYGIKLARAMSTGVPVLWHRTPYSETDGLTDRYHWYVASEPEEAFAKAKHLLCHDEERRWLGENGRTFALKHWEWMTQLKQLRDELR